MSECWALWRKRQTQMGDKAAPERDRLAIETHLERIALQRPNDNLWLDGSLSPDVDVFESLESLPERVDLLARLCAVWDFGI